MSCFPCFLKKDEENGESDSALPGGVKPALNKNDEENVESGSALPGGVKAVVNKNDKAKTINSRSINKDGANGNIQAQTFTFHELATATENFRPDCLIGEGGFGRVYKGYLESTGQVVAIKQLDRNGQQGNKEFTVEILMLSLLHHPNLVNLIGYCADGEQRLLVYEFMPLGSLDDHLLDLKPDKKPLKWHTRMKIAYGAAQGLEYLHEMANPPVIYRDLKSSNILLDEDYNPKLSDFGLAKLGPGGDKFNAASCVMGTYGYCAPEYASIGELTIRSDVYSFGVVLLELISGRRVIDTLRVTNEQNLVSWAQPMFKDQRRFPELVDPLLKCAYPVIDLNQAVGVAAMCLQEEASVRPFMADVVIALSFLTEGPPLSESSPIASHMVKPPIPAEKTQCHPPQPILIDTIDRSSSNSSHSKSSRNGSSRSSSPKPLQRLLEFNQSPSSAYSKHSSHGNESSRSSSMDSVHSEDSTHQASYNPSLNSGQASNQYNNEFEKHYFQHSWSARETNHQGSKHNESDRSSTSSLSSSSSQRHE